MLNGASGELMAGKACEPNYEEMAARLKKLIQADQEALVGLQELVTRGSGRHMRGDNQTTVFAIIGELTIIIPKNEEEYTRLLSEMTRKK